MTDTILYLCCHGYGLRESVAIVTILTPTCLCALLDRLRREYGE